MIGGAAEVRAWFHAALGCDAAIFEKLVRLLDLLRIENASQNLVSTSSLENAWVRHIADSAQLLVVPRETPCGPWLDLGSGAGFPGLVVALCRPDMEVTLVESRAKRIAWLQKAIDHFGIANAHVAQGRLQALETIPARTISARAFAPLAHLIDISARFSTPQTQWLLPKGKNGRQELSKMPNAIQKMFHVEQSLTDLDSVILVGRGVPPVCGQPHR